MPEWGDTESSEVLGFEQLYAKPKTAGYDWTLTKLEDVGNQFVKCFKKLENTKVRIDGEVGYANPNTLTDRDDRSSRTRKRKRYHNFSVSPLKIRVFKCSKLKKNVMKSPQRDRQSFLSGFETLFYWVCLALNLTHRMIKNTLGFEKTVQTNKK